MTTPKTVPVAAVVRTEAVIRALRRELAASRKTGADMATPAAQFAFGYRLTALVDAITIVQRVAIRSVAARAGRKKGPRRGK